MDASLVDLSALTDTAYPVGRQDRHFYFRFFLFWRKVSNVTTNIPVATINEATAKIVETISKAVITPPPFLCIPASRLHKPGRLPPCQGTLCRTILAPESTFHKPILKFHIIIMRHLRCQFL